ncbi:MAG: hypothetical protein AAF555_07415 [Verrucomicrobiota bacterium]
MSEDPSKDDLQRSFDQIVDRLENGELPVARKRRRKKKRSLSGSTYVDARNQVHEFENGGERPLELDFEKEGPRERRAHTIRLSRSLFFLWLLLPPSLGVAFFLLSLQAPTPTRGPEPLAAGSVKETAEGDALSKEEGGAIQVEQEGLLGSEDVSERFQQAVETVRSFLGEPMLEKKIAYLRRTPGLMQHVEHSQNHPIFRLRRAQQYGPRYAVQEGVILLPVTFPVIGERIVPVEETIEGMRLDFDSLIAYSEVSWRSLQQAPPAAPVLLRARAEVVEIKERQGELSEEMILELLHPTKEESVRAVLPSSEWEETSELAHLREEKKVQVTLYAQALKAPREDGIRLEVVELVTLGWFVK